MINIKNLYKQFGGLKALDDVSFEVEEGKITALIGPNGSGKTTLFNMISQTIKPDSGKIYFKEKEITSMLDFEVAKLGISRTFQEVKLFKNLTIKDHFEIAILEDNEFLLKSLTGRKVVDLKISSLLEMVGLNKGHFTVVNELSYGQRKLLCLAIAIARKHNFLMLDEPVAGVNPMLRAEIKKILTKLKKKGETIFLIEHDMNFVMSIADYVYVLDRGKLIAEGIPKKIQKNKKVLEAYLGE